MRRIVAAVDERVLGILLLCLGIGSLVAMLFTGMLSSRFGTRPVIVVSGFGVGRGTAVAGHRVHAIHAGA